ncbi:hypothetical protein [Rubeoparvulum massiliense]|uniref:hypothetical protein n=1 Tax=Rubeoparvulum massiliense TaxID=1631346 RepID=UPI00065E71AC|nr:hypothetical protein [Rubeoparvulum massiliense]
MWLISLLSTVISFIFGLIFLKKTIRRPRFSNILYTLSMFMFALATFGEFYSDAFGWTASIYKLYYFSALTLVPIMAAATIYVKMPRIAGHIFLLYVVVLAGLLLYNLIPAHVSMPLLQRSGVSVGGNAMPTNVRGFSFWLSGVGGILLMVVAIWSWWSARLAGHLLIAGGAFLMSLGGRLAAIGYAYFLPLDELFGIILIFVGVLALERRVPLFPRKAEAS